MTPVSLGMGGNGSNYYYQNGATVSYYENIQQKHFSEYEIKLIREGYQNEYSYSKEI